MSKKAKKRVTPLVPRMGKEASCLVTRRKAGVMKHRNSIRQGAKKENFNEGWE